MTDEEWYDQEIAPALKKVGEACKARGASMCATVEYAPGQRGSTFVHGGTRFSLEMNMLAMCAKAGTNVDLYMLSLSRFCEENNIDVSESIFLRMVK